MYVQYNMLHNYDILSTPYMKSRNKMFAKKADEASLEPLGDRWSTRYTWVDRQQLDVYGVIRASFGKLI